MMKAAYTKLESGQWGLKRVMTPEAIENELITREQILDALAAWSRQRPGLDPRNYGDARSFRSESRSITRDLRDFRTLLAAVRWRESIDVAALRDAFRRAYSGRLSLHPEITQHTPETCPGRPCSTDCSHKEGRGVRLSYCTGQYWPTEYRRAACAVLASVLWEHARDNMPAPKGKITRSHGVGSYAGSFTSEHDNIEGKTPGEWLRDYFRKEFGRRIQSRWFA